MRSGCLIFSSRVGLSNETVLGLHGAAAYKCDIHFELNTLRHCCNATLAYLHSYFDYVVFAKSTFFTSALLNTRRMSSVFQPPVNGSRRWLTVASWSRTLGHEAGKRNHLPEPTQRLRFWCYFHHQSATLGLRSAPLFQPGYSSKYRMSLKDTEEK